MINVKTYIPSGFAANCYLAYEDSCPSCFIVDPGAKDERLPADIEKAGLAPEFIILTHGHGDHTGGIDWLRSLYPGIKLAAHKKEAALLYDRKLSYGKGGIRADIWTDDGFELEVGTMRLRFIATPGHTPGGQCILLGKYLFSGDTLFRASIGRTDLYGGSCEEIAESITNKLFKLPEDTAVLPGHMDATTIGYEMRYNPFV